MSVAVGERWNDLLRATRSWRVEWNVDELLARIVREGVELLQAQRGVIFLIEEGDLKPRTAWPLSTVAGEKDSPHSPLRLARQVVDSGRSLFAHNLESGSRRAPIRGVCCVPLPSSRGILGALYLESAAQTRNLTHKDEEFFEMLGLQAAAALEHAILYQSAITDPLTGLFTHRHFQQEVEQALRRAVRSEQPLTLIVMDLDHFKRLNDTKGHAAGNRCLVAVAGILRGALRSSDTIARFGGDEFEILLPDTPATGALKVAEKLRKTIAARVKFGVTATLGLAAYPQNAALAQELFLRADGALYQAKAAGRNCVVISECLEKKVPSSKALRGQASAGKALQVLDPRLPLAKPVGARELAVREQVDGHLVLKRLGMGSTGEVLLVRQPELNREVALKRPHTRQLSPTQIAAFEKEAQLTGQLEHPGVVSIYTMGRDADGRRYYTMKPLRGHSLTEIMDARLEKKTHSHESFTLNRLLEVLHRVAETIAYAHQRNIAHLDLTPSNIMVGNFGEVTVIDWASGTRSSSRRRQRLAGGKRGVSFVRGSPNYVAPEQLPGAHTPPGPAADVFALGAILYEMLTGTTPFARDDTRQMLAALVKGQLVPPENVAPNASIDAAISSLCMEALSHECALRPTARLFAERLGRYVRNEIEWIVTRFDAAHRLSKDDWMVTSGQWKLENGEWISLGQNENMLQWKIPLQDGFRLICEGWVEREGELSLTGRTSAHAEKASNPFGSMTFQFGGERQYAKLSCGPCTMYKPGFVPKPGQKYRLELHYLDGWTYCYLDGERLFTYREPFRFPGRAIGLYTWGPGAHFRPEEIHRQPWQLQVSAVRLADKLFQRNHYDEALQEYQGIASAIPRRLEGLEARLKAGMCLAQLKRWPEADLAFRQLEGTILEPYGLAQSARQGLLGAKRNVARAVRLFNKLFKLFPESQACNDLCEVLNNAGERLFKSRTEYLSVRAALEGLLLDYYAPISPPPVNALYTASARAYHLVGSARYAEALQFALKYRQQLLPAHRGEGEFQPNFWTAALANGRDDLLDDPPGQRAELDTGVREWFSDPLVGALTRKGELLHFLRRVRANGHPWQAAAPRRFALNLLGIHLALKRTDSLNWYRQHVELGLSDETGDVWPWQLGAALVSARRGELFDLFLHKISRFQSPEFKLLRINVQARWALEGGDLPGAVHLLSEIEQPVVKGFCSLPQLLLSSLGLLQRPSIGELAKYSEKHLAGTYLDLARMFLGKRAPLPGEPWPHPLWCPELRLWLGLWLEARGQRKRARHIVAPARDPRYGWTYSQPAIELLLERTK